MASMKMSMEENVNDGVRNVSRKWIRKNNNVA